MNRIITKLIFILFVLLPFICSKQAVAQYNLSGKIYSTGETKELLKHVSVYNVSTQEQMYSTDEGFYTLPIHKGDTVLFEMLGYFSYKYFAGAITGAVQKNVLLAAKINQLAGVKVTSTTQYQKDSISREKLFGKAVKQEQVSTLNSPVTSLYQQFSKKYKDLRKFQAQYAENEKQKYIDTKYTYELVNKITKLEGDSAAYFMNAYPMEYNFARTSNETYIKFWIIANYKEYFLGQKNKAVTELNAVKNPEKK